MSSIRATLVCTHMSVCASTGGYQGLGSSKSGWDNRNVLFDSAPELQVGPYLLICNVLLLISDCCHTRSVTTCGLVWAFYAVECLHTPQAWMWVTQRVFQFSVCLVSFHWHISR